MAALRARRRNSQQPHPGVEPVVILPTLRPRERDALIQSLRSGVTPRTGARHI